MESLGKPLPPPLHLALRFLWSSLIPCKTLSSQQYIHLCSHHPSQLYLRVQNWLPPKITTRKKVNNHHHCSRSSLSLLTLAQSFIMSMEASSLKHHQNHARIPSLKSQPCSAPQRQSSSITTSQSLFPNSLEDWLWMPLSIASIVDFVGALWR